MIQPMAYGYSADYSNDNFSGYFDWSTNNKATEVLENIMATNDMAYGFPSGIIKNLEPKTSVLNFSDSNTNPYRGAIAHPNGKIYFFPSGANNILELEPTSKSLRFWGNLGSGSSNKLVGACLNTDGMMYSFPTASYTSGGIIKWNPYSRTSTLITTTTNSNGCILHPNGKIYGVPAAGNIIEFEPETQRINTFGSGTIGTSIYYGASIHPNGNIYYAPFQNTTDDVLELNVNTKKLTIIQTKTAVGGSNSFFQSIILAPNRLMYCVPFSAERILEVNPYTRSSRVVGPNIGGGTQKFSSGCIGPDGCIYMMPHNFTTSSVLKYNWKTEEVEYINVPGFLTSSSRCSGAVLAQDGCIYGAPLSSTAGVAQILKIDFGIGVKKGVYCREVNKF